MTNTLNDKRGFTLTELAIVLGLIGIIISAVWTAAQHVYSQKRVTQAVQQIMTITQGMRALYASASVTGFQDGNPLTLYAINMHIIPTEMGTSNPLVTPWGPQTGAIITSQSQTTSPPNTGDAFEIEYRTLPPSGCVALLMALDGPSRDNGLFYANASFAAQGAATLVGRQASLPIPIVDSSQVTDRCNVDTAVAVELAFKLN